MIGLLFEGAVGALVGRSLGEAVADELEDLVPLRIEATDANIRDACYVGRRRESEADIGIVVFVFIFIFIFFVLYVVFVVFAVVVVMVVAIIPKTNFICVRIVEVFSKSNFIFIFIFIFTTIIVVIVMAVPIIVMNIIKEMIRTRRRLQYCPRWPQYRSHQLKPPLPSRA